MFVLVDKMAPVDQVTFAPTGQYLAVGVNWDAVTVWDLATQQVVGRRGREKGYTRSEFRFQPTGPGIYRTSHYGEVIRDDLIGRNGEIVVERGGWVENVLVTRDEKRVLVHDRAQCQFRLFDLTRGGGGPVWSVPVFSSVTHGVRLNMEFLPGEERFLVAENHGNTRTRVSVRSLATGELLAAARFPQRETLGLALSPDGAVAVVVSEMSLFVYEVGRLRVAPRKVKNDNRKHFKGVAFHPSGRYLATASNDQTVKLYDTTSWEVVKAYTWDVGRMLRVAFSPDGTLAAAGGDTGKVVVWDVDL